LSIQTLDRQQTQRSRPKQLSGCHNKRFVQEQRIKKSQHTASTSRQKRLEFEDGENLVGVRLPKPLRHFSISTETHGNFRIRSNEIVFMAI
jgi:hypothetical protein